MHAKRVKRLCVAALIGNAAIVLVVVPWLSSVIARFYGIGFADDYDTIAFNLVQGYGYRLYPDAAQTLMREPGYPLFLAGVFKGFGYSIGAARFANVALVIAIVAMIVKLARTVSENPIVPMLAVVLFLFHPGTLVAEVRGSVEILFICGLLVFILTLHWAIRKGDLIAFVSAGAVLGLVVLTRSTPLLFPVFVMAYLLAKSVSLRERAAVVLKIGLLVAAMVAVMSPWIVRNWILTREFVPTASVQGVAAQTGQYICSHLGFETNFIDLDRAAARERDVLAKQLGRPFKVGYYQYFYLPQDELAFNRLLLSTVTENYRQNPALLLKCPSVNVFNFWFAGKTWGVTWLNVMFQLPFMMVAFTGAYVTWRRGHAHRIAILLLFSLYLFLLHVPIHAQARYSIPLVPFLSIFAGVAIGSAWERVSQERVEMSAAASGGSR